MHPSPLPETPSQERLASWHQPWARNSVTPRLATPAMAVSRATVVSVGATAVVLVLIASLIGTGERLPANALVVAVPSSRVYLAPACALGVSPGTQVIISRTAAEARGLTPDAACTRNGAFIGREDTRWMQLLSWLHLTPRRQSRWRPDGSWRW